MAVELFANLASTTVSSGGTTAPAPGTTETWTVASSATFPTAVSGTSQFHIQEDDSVKQSEIILVTNVSGTTWSVTRGVEGTTPVAHTTGFTVIQTVTAAVLTALGAVSSVAGRTGAVTLTAADIGSGTFPAGVAVPSGSFFRLAGIADLNHYIGYNATPNGPDVSGFAGGRLGYTNGGAFTPQLAWSTTGVTVAGTLSSTGNLSENGNRVYSAGNAPPYPVTSVATRTGAVTLTAADVAAGTFSGVGFNFSNSFTSGGGFAATGVISTITGLQSNFASTATSGSPAVSSGYLNFTTSYWNGASASQAVASFLATVASPSGATTLTATAGTLATTGAVTAAGLLTASSGVTIPSGQPLTVGTKKTFGGTLALAATANAATVLGQFSSTAGSMALRLHVHLVTGGVQRTKTYEVVVDTATDATNTYYKLLPADQSTAQAAASDVALEIYRPSTATTTWQIWVRTAATFASTGAITWSAESYGDTVVTYAATLSPATSASGSPITAVLHPSNKLDTVAGRVGIGTDSPTTDLDVVGTGNFQSPTGGVPLTLKARTNANGGQSSNLLEFTGPDGNMFVYFDSAGNLGGLGSVNVGSVSVGNSLGAAGTLLIARIGNGTIPNFPTAALPLQNSSFQKFRSAYWNGSSGVEEDQTLQSVRASVTPGDVDLVLTTGRLKVGSFGVVTSGVTTANKLSVSANASPPASPATGDLWIVSDVTAPSTPLAPLGYVAGNSNTAAGVTLSTTLSTETAVAPTATFTPVAGRRYRLSMSARANAGVANQLVALRLNSSSGPTRLMDATELMAVTGGSGQQTITQVRTIQAGDTGFPAGTSCTFTLVATQTAGATTTAASIVANTAGALTNFIIEDIGV